MSSARCNTWARAVIWRLQLLANFSALSPTKEGLHDARKGLHALNHHTFAHAWTLDAAPFPYFSICALTLSACILALLTLSSLHTPPPSPFSCNTTTTTTTPRSDAKRKKNRARCAKKREVAKAKAKKANDDALYLDEAFIAATSSPSPPPPPPPPLPRAPQSPNLRQSCSWRSGRRSRVITRSWRLQGCKRTRRLSKAPMIWPYAILHMLLFLSFLSSLSSASENPSLFGGSTPSSAAACDGGDVGDDCVQQVLLRFSSMPPHSLSPLPGSQPAPPPQNLAGLIPALFALGATSIAVQVTIECCPGECSGGVPDATGTPCPPLPPGVYATFYVYPPQDEDPLPPRLAFPPLPQASPHSMPRPASLSVHVSQCALSSSPSSSSSSPQQPCVHVELLEAPPTAQPHNLPSLPPFPPALWDSLACVHLQGKITHGGGERITL